MGNKIARTTQASATEYYLHDLPSSFNLVLKEVIGRGRFFKSIICKHDEGLVLVKVYFRRGDPIDFNEYGYRLKRILEVFRSIQDPHVWPFQLWLATDKAAYVLRQYFFNNLHDRLSTRPFLSHIEKKWLAFQLLCGVKQSHDHGICHGDIKCENVLVTSSNWVYLADFASFKPTYIPDDDPSDFSFFFDTGGRRLCYLAPERFFEHGGDMPVASDAPLKPSMDIFSVGCVIAELFLESQPLFELSQLLAYRRGQFDPSQHLEKIPDLGIRKMILHMIQLDPESRLSAEGYLQTYASFMFPNYLSPFLHSFYSCLNPLDCDTKVAVCQSAFHEIHKEMTSTRFGQDTTNGLGSCPNDGGCGTSELQDALHDSSLIKDLNKDVSAKGLAHKHFELFGDLSTILRDVNLINHFSNDKKIRDDASKISEKWQQYSLQSPNQLVLTISDAFKKQERNFLKNMNTDDLKSLMSEYDSESDSYNMPFLWSPPEDLSCEGMILITSLLCSCLRNVKSPHLRRSCILLLKCCSLYIDDDSRLQRVLPYVIAMLSDPAAIVRCAALETLSDILPLVRDFPPSDAKIFPEYILPMLSMLPDDPEESVRICYASNISKLALTAYGFLIHSLRLREAGVLDEPSLPQQLNAPSTDSSGRSLKVNGNLQLAQLRKSIAEVVQELVMGPKQTPNIRRALLQDIGSLCCFFGQRLGNDFLLPILPAFLNDRDEQLRELFYSQIIYVCFFVGERSVEEYLLPYIEQALSDTTTGVIVKALDCLTVLCKNGFLRKRILLEMIDHAFPLLCYPSQWVRRSVVTFIAATSDSLGPIDSYVFLVPLIRPFLRRQPASLASEKEVLSCLKPPVSKEIFYQLFENARSSDMIKRQRKVWYSSTQDKQWGTVEFPKEAEELLSSTSWPEADQEQKNSNLMGNSLHQSETNELDSADAKLKTLGGYIYAPCNSLDVPHLYSEKLQFSGLMSPQLNGMNSFFGDHSSENIPLYSFNLDKHAGENSETASISLLHRSSIGTGTSSTPWMNPANRTLGLASSIPGPKLVSGAFSISSGTKQFHRVVHEPESRETDQNTSISSKFVDLAISNSTKGSVSSIEEASSSNTLASPSSSWTSSVPDSGWRPRGVLVAHLQEHRSAVNDIAVSSDHSFFVTASDDSSVKVWESRKLEKDISFRSRLSYPLGGSQGLCLTMLRDSSQVIVGACDGKVHVFSVAEKYSGVIDVKKKEVGEGAVISISNFSVDSSVTQMVMYSTRNCGIHLWDVRSSSDSSTLKAIPEEGYISSLVADPSGNWFVSGSSRGVLTLWDLRFLIPVNSWVYPHPCLIEKMCLFVPPSASLPATSRPLVYVAAGPHEVSLWNAENGSCHQVLKVISNDSNAELSDSPWALARPVNMVNVKSDPRRNSNPKYRVDELNDPPRRLSGIRSLLPLPGGDLLTGGTDLKIRRWDHSRPERSYCMCGPTIKGVGNDEVYETKSSFGVQVVQERMKRPLPMKLTARAILAAAATDPAGCHRDSIISLASVKLSQRLLISGSRDGAIKVWR
ncbi:hypothetical protein Droror1_Dr00007349 [Drosera rotundifolia]